MGNKWQVSTDHLTSSPAPWCLGHHPTCGIVYRHINIMAVGCTEMTLHSWTTAFRQPWCFVDVGGVGWGEVEHVLRFMWTCRWSTCYGFAAGRCMYSWVGWGGVGWGGACITVHVNLQMKYMLRCGCRQVHVFMGGVGCGVACINVHVNLQMKDMLRWLPAGACMHGWGGAGWDNNVHGSLFHRSCYTTLCSLELCTHASCYATVCSLELCTHASCYATVCSLELCTHASCYAIVCSLELCTHASCYATVCSLELCTHASCYATVCSLELCTHASCYTIVCSLGLCTHESCYATVCCLELCTHAPCYAIVCSLEQCYAPPRDTICVHVVLAFKLTESRS